MNEPVAMRYDFDGYGYRYIDSGSGSDWQTRKKGEPLYTHSMRELSDESITNFAKVFGLWDGALDYNGFARAILRKAQEK